VATVYAWPKCTYRHCDHRRTWPSEKGATEAYMAHPSWSQGDQAVCLCHDPIAGFPCDQALIALQEAMGPRDA
jgi:hypothetical protein